MHPGCGIRIVRNAVSSGIWLRLLQRLRIPKRSPPSIPLSQQTILLRRTKILHDPPRDIRRKTLPIAVDGKDFRQDQTIVVQYAHSEQPRRGLGEFSPVAFDEGGYFLFHEGCHEFRRCEAYEGVGCQRRVLSPRRCWHRRRRRRRHRRDGPRPPIRRGYHLHDAPPDPAFHDLAYVLKPSQPLVVKLHQIDSQFGDGQYS
mmetsp:Transcript_3564/g.7542  ORF Transcript_3564/g.7542 Transcript_3564/m.7542 type:complete len:201 (-) Transcript_3564:18-620(-)